mmetsp:Transcript_2877/g.7374  ORF Transcript_2877/g.7374 Transcript_2877/m.7374 type:complete len:387 (-) Transcript_2877:198-1358(-)
MATTAMARMYPRICTTPVAPLSCASQCGASAEGDGHCSGCDTLRAWSSVCFRNVFAARRHGPFNAPRNAASIVGLYTESADDTMLLTAASICLSSAPDADSLLRPSTTMDTDAGATPRASMLSMRVARRAGTTQSPKSRAYCVGWISRHNLASTSSAAAASREIGDAKDARTPNDSLRFCDVLLLDDPAFASMQTFICTSSCVSTSRPRSEDALLPPSTTRGAKRATPSTGMVIAASLAENFTEPPPAMMEEGRGKWACHRLGPFMGNVKLASVVCGLVALGGSVRDHVVKAADMPSLPIASSARNAAARAYALCVQSTKWLLFGSLLLLLLLPSSSSSSGKTAGTCSCAYGATTRLTKACTMSVPFFVRKAFVWSHTYDERNCSS